MRKTTLGIDRKSDDVELNMSPLIDMIFILLIFFLVTTTFVKESGVDVNRPVPSEKTNPTEEANIQINVTRDGMVYVDGQAIDIRSVQSRMERFIYENPEGNVIITSDKESRFGVSVEVLDQVRLANIKNVVVTPSAE